ncbi:MAG: DUF1673 domain-containing protein [Methanomicrobiales archaeon]|nr:DUF1673 domain-containing protein [Methanomicrobiales archaeon]
MGWCPQECTLSRQPPVLNDDIVSDVPAQASGMPARSGWLERYRNQVLLMAVSFTLVSIPLVAVFQTNDLTRLLLYFGTIAGLVVFTFFGRWLWNSLEMLKKGMTIKTGVAEYIILSFIAGAIPMSVVLIIAAVTVPLSFAGAWAFPAFATGFAFIPWYVYILILLWERKTGCVLMFDKKAHSFSAVRCPSYALH